MQYFIPKPDWERTGNTIVFGCPKCGTPAQVHAENVDDAGKSHAQCPSRSCDFNGDVQIQGFKR